MHLQSPPQLDGRLAFDEATLYAAADDLGPFGQVVLSAFRRDAVRTPLVRLPEDELCWQHPLTSSDDRRGSRSRDILSHLRETAGSTADAAT